MVAQSWPMIRIAAAFWDITAKLSRFAGPCNRTKRPVTTHSQCGRIGARALGTIGVITFLSGCAGSVLDPAPYDPQNDPAVLKSVTPPTPIGILTFSSNNDAAQKLQALSEGYAIQRDDMMRQELLFDIPMIGLGVAAIANPLFNGAKDVTLGLSLGAATATGGRLYFGPQAKVSAYNAAAQDLLCARSAASQIGGVANSAANGRQLIGALEGNINLALPLVSANVTLAAARDQAVKSQGTLQTALGNYDQAPAELQDYAISVIAGTDNKIIGGTQNTTSWLSAVQAAAAAGAKTPAVAPAPGAVLPPGAVSPAPTAAQLTSTLQNESVHADAITSIINAAVGKLAKCPAP